MHAFHDLVVQAVSLPPAMRKVSVILTTYNSGESLGKVLDAIVGQQGAGTDYELELLVVDDCSTDGTRDILAAKGIAFLSTGKNSGGPNRGRNIGMKMATGDCIAIADHDDVWHSDKLASLLPHLHDAPIVTSGYTLIDTKTGRHTDRVGKGTGCKDSMRFDANVTFRNRLIRSHGGQQAYLGSILFSSELKHVRFEEEYGMVDYDWMLGLFHMQPSIEVLRPLYTRYVDGSNLSLNADYREKDFLHSIETLKKYEKLYPQDVKLARKRIHGTRARYFYLMDRMPEARHYFVRSQWNLKTLLYYLTTFVGSDFVKRHFHIFG